MESMDAKCENITTFTDHWIQLRCVIQHKP